MPSSRHSSDTDVSRCAIADWASLTWAFDSANFLPLFRPRARAASSPATVAFADQLPFELGQRREDAEHEAARPRSECRSAPLAGEHPQARPAGRQVLHGVERAWHGEPS